MVASKKVEGLEAAPFLKVILSGSLSVERWESIKSSFFRPSAICDNELVILRGGGGVLFGKLCFLQARLKK